MSIKIGLPRIIHNGKLARLESDISWMYRGENVQEIVFFEIEDQWINYLSSELSDPFVLAMFEIAIESGQDIEFEAPMTEDLKYQLERYLIPIFAKKANKLKPFNLIGSTVASRINSEGAVATGFSAGVDSFYSIIQHIDSPYKSKKVKYLMLAVNGAAKTGVNEEIDQAWYKEEMIRFTPLAEELGLILIGVNSNISMLNKYRNLIKGGSGITTASFVHALRKLFGTYYWASAYEADILEFRTDDMGYLEPFFLPLLSVDGLRFYHSGCEVNRIEKVKIIADNPVAQKGLNVCSMTINCGGCRKCTRTMAELYAIGKLEKFDRVFPYVAEYERNFSRNLARELAQDHPPFTIEILDKLKENNINVPLTTYLWKWLWFKPFNALKKRLRYNKIVMKLYYEKGWLERLGEYRPSEDIIKAKMSGGRSEK